jgi:hypothetical protein
MVVRFRITGDPQRLALYRSLLLALLCPLESHPYSTPRDNSYGITSLHKTPGGRGVSHVGASTPRDAIPAHTCTRNPCTFSSLLHNSLYARKSHRRHYLHLPISSSPPDSSPSPARSLATAGPPEPYIRLYSKWSLSLHFPPATPFTLHVTLLLLALATAAVNTCEFPNSTSTLPGVTVTLTEAGGGLGGVGVVGPARPGSQRGAPGRPNSSCKQCEQTCRPAIRG